MSDKEPVMTSTFKFDVFHASLYGRKRWGIGIGSRDIYLEMKEDQAKRLARWLSSRWMEAKAPEWISVDERMPDRGCPVFACQEGTATSYKAVYIDPEWYCGEVRVWPTHWMHQPHPPEKEISGDLELRVRHNEERIQELREHAVMFQDMEVCRTRPTPAKPFYMCQVIGSPYFLVGHLALGKVIQFPSGGKDGNSKRAAEKLCTKLNEIWTSDKGSTDGTD